MINNCGLDTFVSRCKGFNKSRTLTSAPLFSIPTSALTEVGIQSTESVVRDGTLFHHASAAVGAPTLHRAASLGRSCTTCGVQFDDLATQQAHCKSTWHQSNLRRQLKGLPARPLKKAKGKSGSSGTSSTGNADDIDTSSISSSSDSDNDDEDSEEQEDEEEDEIDRLEGLDEEEELEGSRVGKPNTLMTTSQGTVRWGEYSGSNGLQVTYCPVATTGTTWHITVNNLLLQTHVVPGTALHEGKAHGNGNGSSSSSSNSSSNASSPSSAINPWERLGSVLSMLRERPLVCVLILRSGKFAGAIFDGTSVLEHKIFRRYTRRAKAGGAQSSHDKKGGAAKSAGAQMRRAGEEALQAEVAGLLQAWRGYIEESSVILISVPRAMRAVIFEDNAPNAVLKKSDPRIRTIPFLVRQPTFAETQVVHTRFTAVIFTKVGSKMGLRLSAGGSACETGDSSSVGIKESVTLTPIDELNDALTELALEASQRGLALQKELWDARSRERAKKKEKRSQKDKKSNKDSIMNAMVDEFEAQESPLSDAVFKAIRLGDVKAVQSVLQELATSVISSPGLDRQNSDASASSYMSSTSTSSGMTIEIEDLWSVLRRPETLVSLSTPLHIAAELGKAEICSILLEAGTNPGFVDARNRSAYSVAKDKATRDSFRRSRAVIEGMGQTGGPPLWDWNWEAAGVPAGITEEAEAARKEKEKEKEKEKKKRAKARKHEQAQTELQVQADAILAKSILEQERELRVLNAISSAGDCAQCQKSLYKIKAIVVPGGEEKVKCCSDKCCVSYGRAQRAAAAERRMLGAGAGAEAK